MKIDKVPKIRVTMTSTEGMAICDHQWKAYCMRKGGRGVRMDCSLKRTQKEKEKGGKEKEFGDPEARLRGEQA